MSAHHDFITLPILHLRQVQYFAKTCPHTRAGKFRRWCLVSLAGRPISLPGTTSSAPAHPSTAAELKDLQVKRDHYFHKGLASNTHRTYSSAQRQYLAFCERHNLLAVPGDENTMLLFITELATRISPQSIKVYMAGVRALHISNGFHNPFTNTVKLQQTLRGIEREHFSAVKQKLPITFDLLCRMRNFIDDNNKDDTVYWAATTTAHFLLLRASEFVKTDMSDQVLLNIEDVNFERTPTGEEYMTVRIKKSKTDQKGSGILLYTGHSKHKVCAVCAMKENLLTQQQRENYSVHDSLFTMSSGNPLTRKELTHFVSVILRLLGIDPQNFSGHSFRIGGATSASVAGLHDYQIKLLGRWSSDCYKSYIRSPVSMFLQIATQISSTQDITYQYASPYSPN